MKVLTLSHMYPSTFNNVFGIFVHEQAKALKKKGIDIRVVSAVPWTPFPINIVSGKWKKYSMIPKYTMWEGIPVWYPKYLTFPRTFFFESSGERMYQGIKKLVKDIYQNFKFDMIHAHVALPDGFAAMKLAKEFNIPYIVTIHGQDLYVTAKKNIECLKVIIKVFKQANKIILVSNELKKIAINSIGFCDKLIVIGNGVPMSKIYGRKKSFLSWGINNENKTLLSVSYLIKRKGIDFNIRAFSKLLNKYPSLRYTIIGDGAEKNNLEALAKKLGVSDKVEFVGMLSHDEVMKRMVKADIFSLPSWNEAFGVVYIEAMACGKPVIGCKGEGIEDFVDNGKTGILVNPKDVDSLTKAIDFLLSNPDGAKAMGERARRLVLENYTWEINAEKTIKVYQEVLDNGM